MLYYIVIIIQILMRTIIFISALITWIFIRNAVENDFVNYKKMINGYISNALLKDPLLDYSSIKAEIALGYILFLVPLQFSC